METTVSRLQEDCRLLQEALHNSIPTVDFSTRHPTSDVSRGPSSRPIATPSRPTSSSVPYEALGTLRMNRLNTASNSRGVSSSVREEEKESVGSEGRGTKSVSMISFGTTVASEGGKAAAVANGPRVNASTQTTETAFALCARCSETQNSLVGIASSISKLCTEFERESFLADTDWSSLAKVGGVVAAEWERALRKDLETLSGCNHELTHRCRQLTSEISDQWETIRVLDSGSKLLSSELNTLKESIDEVERRSEASLAATRKGFFARVKVLEEARERGEAENRRTREQLNAAQRKEAQLRALVTDLGECSPQSSPWSTHSDCLISR